MDNKYKELFDKITPRMSDEKLLSAVLDRKAVNMGNSNEKKKFGRKAVVIPAVAAAVMLCTTIGVSAAYEWNLSAAISDIFGRNSENIPDGVNFKDFNFATVGGRELNDVLKFDGYEVQMKGVAGDPHHMQLFFDVKFEDIDFSLNDGEALMVEITPPVELGLYKDYLGGNGETREERDKKIDGSAPAENMYLGMEKNVAHFCFKQRSFGPSWSDVSRTLGFGSLSKIDAATRKVIEVINEIPHEDSREYNVDMDFINESGSIDILNDTDITLSNGLLGTLTHMQLTPFGICFKVSWGERLGTFDCEAAGSALYDEFRIKFKDGTTMDNSAFSFKDTAGIQKEVGESIIYRQEATFEWLYPVNVADIEALIIGTTTVPVSQ